MSDAELFAPLRMVWEWASTYVIHLGEHYFTFADIWIWEILIVVIIVAYRFIFDD